MASTTVAVYRLGERLAFREVPQELRAACQDQAAAFYAQQLAASFSEQVDTLLVPRQFAQLRRTWVPPAQLLRGAGFRLAGQGTGHWVATCGVDPHVDCVWGPSLLWTIHNDGLQFRQRGVRREPPAGDIMVFDDAQPHSMDLTAAQHKNAKFDAAVWIGWAIPLERGRAD